MQEINLIERDPKEINSFIQVLFHDVIAEPYGSYSSDNIWIKSNKLYNGSKNCCYKFLSSIFMIPISLFCGCFLGFTAFYQIWLCIPYLRYKYILFKFFRRINGILKAVCMAPEWNTYGLFFNRIDSRFSFSSPPKKFMERPYSSDYIKNEKKIFMQKIHKDWDIELLNKQVNHDDLDRF
ncbi:unnamed protein product [Brachionus calyciflorus]|uniref:Caveolin n=1 Tax=Brachionus calyciflorus TaxID=104777 RepID=A0A814HAL9_9BILA|nr:unnamed protein product [Brachionus calyciflorus]